MKKETTVAELIQSLKECNPDAIVRVEISEGCDGPTDWLANPEVNEGYDETSVLISVEKGCMCVKSDRVPLPEILVENTAMKKEFKELRKIAFFDRLDRMKVMELCCKFIGNK